MDAYDTDIRAVEKIARSEQTEGKSGAKAKATTESSPEAALNALLKQTKTLLQARRRTMANGFLAIAEQIGTLSGSLSRSQLRAYLVSECGIDRADLNTYLKLTELNE